MTDGLLQNAGALCVMHANTFSSLNALGSSLFLFHGYLLNGLLVSYFFLVFTEEQVS
jgi:hypothetical protein